MNQKKVIAVFGGAFNPPINSHIILAKQIIEKCEKIEKLIFVPVSTKYQKQDLAADVHRYNMLKLMCKNNHKLEVSDIELKEEKQLYTIQTLDKINEEYGADHDIWFVTGTDNLKQLETWHNPYELLKKYKILVLQRGEDNLEDIIQQSKLLVENKESIITIEGIDKINLSSTEIRRKIKNGESIKQYVPKEIIEYIKENKLYWGQSPCDILSQK